MNRSSVNICCLVLRPIFQTPCCILYYLNMTTDAFKLFVIETDGYLNIFAKFQYNGKCPGKFLQYKQWKRKCDAFFTSLYCLFFSFLAYFQSVIMISSGSWLHLLDLSGQLDRLEYFTIESTPFHGAVWKKIFFFLKLSELRKGKFKASFLGRSVKAKFKVKNLHSSKENLSGFDFPALPSLISMGTGDRVVGQAGKGGADSERRRKVWGWGLPRERGASKMLYGACAVLTLRFFVGILLPQPSLSSVLKKLTIRFHLGEQHLHSIPLVSRKGEIKSNLRGKGWSTCTSESMEHSPVMRAVCFKCWHLIQIQGFRGRPGVAAASGWRLEGRALDGGETGLPVLETIL